MIAWFQSDRREDCGCSSKVITVYFRHTQGLAALRCDLQAVTHWRLSSIELQSRISAAAPLRVIFEDAG